MLDLIIFSDNNTDKYQNDFEFEEGCNTIPFDRNNFSSKVIAPIDNKEKRYVQCPSSSVELIDYKNVEKLTNNLDISKNQRYYFFVDGNFIFGDLIEAFVVNRDMLVKELTISTLYLSMDNKVRLFFITQTKR